MAPLQPDAGGVKAVRVLAVAAVFLVAVYFAFRAIAASCTGAACDAYIPVSLLLPLAIWLVAAVAGVTATVRARSHHTWFSVLVGAAVLGVAGPIVALAIFRDSPDAFVAGATVLVLLEALAALGYTFTRSG